MAKRTDEGDRGRVLPWRDRLQKYAGLILAAGLPKVVTRSEARWRDSVEHGFLADHPDPSAFHVNQLSIRQKAALLRLLLNWQADGAATVLGSRLVHDLLEVVERASEGLLIQLPTRMRLICHADGVPIQGMFVNLTLKVRRKNNFHVMAGPTDNTGTAIVTRADIDGSVQASKELFLMDYTSLADFTGEIVIRPFNREGIEQALQAYETFREHCPYPEGYQEHLLAAKRILEELAPATLSVDIDHNGEGITVEIDSVPA